MIVVDTSVWIDFFNGNASREVSILDYYLDQEQIVIGDLILVELLQGFRKERDLNQVNTLLACLTYRDMTNRSLAYQAAEHYRILRQKGITIYKTIDVMIATFCIENQLPLLHRDKDFESIKIHLPLITV